jgi:hypothetical protein
MRPDVIVHSEGCAGDRRLVLYGMLYDKHLRGVRYNKTGFMNVIHLRDVRNLEQVSAVKGLLRLDYTRQVDQL